MSRVNLKGPKLFGALSVVLLSAACVRADSLTFDMANVFSGVVLPANPPPWVEAVFSSSTPGTVTLTLKDLDLAAGEFASDWYFNVKAGVSLAASDLHITGGPAGVSISQGLDSFKADGDGFYDVELGMSGFHLIDPGGTTTFTITGTGADASITASSFDALSTGSPSPFGSAVHIQGLNLGNSVWASPGPGAGAPEPATIVSLATMVIGFGACYAVRRKRA